MEQLRRALFAAIPPAAPVTPDAEGGQDLADYLVYRPRTSHRAPFRVFRTDRGFLVYRLPRGQSLACSASREFPNRGRFGGPVALLSGFPFGFLECAQPAPVPETRS